MKNLVTIIALLLSLSGYAQRKVYVKNANPAGSGYKYGIGINWNYTNPASFENDSDIESGQITNTFSCPANMPFGKEKIIINLLENPVGNVLTFSQKQGEFNISDSGISKGNIGLSCPPDCQTNAPSIGSIKGGANEGVQGYLIGCVTHSNTDGSVIFKTFIYKKVIRSNIYYSLLTKRI